MTRKKYIKVLMSLGAQRNEANRLAEYQRLQHGSYTDIRTDGWPSLHLFGLRCGLIARTIVDKVANGIILCMGNIEDLNREIDNLSGVISMGLGEATEGIEQNEEFDL